MSELYTAVIGIGILIVILFLFWNANRKKKKKEEAFDKYFQQQVDQHKLSIDTKDVLRDFVLALDKNNKKLLYIKNFNENPESILIDLNEVRNCKVTENVQTFYLDDEKKQKDSFIAQIALELSYSKTDERFVITFYDYIAHGINLMREMRPRAASWEKRIKEVIGKVKA
ncbi:MAG TPA: hypothetical protein VGN63_15100 [Flavisolibacter sp.]|jgi:hypothetical protein|nr:hypothetical protein [Flavisolibacter sp.]